MVILLLVHVPKYFYILYKLLCTSRYQYDAIEFSFNQALDWKPGPPYLARGFDALQETQEAQYPGKQQPQG